MARDQGVASALDATTRRALPAIFLGVGGFYLALVAISSFLDGPSEPAQGLVARWAATAVLGLGGAAVLRRFPPRDGWSNPIGGALGALTLLNSLALVGSAGPSFLFAIIVALLAFALFLLSVPWVVGLALLALGGWGLLAVQAGGGPEWIPRTFNLLAFCIVAIVVQAMRVGLLGRLARMTAREVQHQAQQQLALRDRALLEQRGRIVRMTSHELATPLTPVILATHLLEATDLPPEARGHLATLKRNLDRLRVTVDRILAAARADEATEKLYREDTERGGALPDDAPDGPAKRDPPA